MLALMLGSLLLWGVSKRRRRGGVGLGFGADVGQPLGAAAHKLLRVTSASDDGTAASAGGSYVCGGASSREDVEAGGARWMREAASALNQRDALVTSKSA